MTTLNPATRLSSPELAVTRAGPPLRVRLPAGWWQVGFRTQHDGRTVIEVTGQDGSLAGLVASSRLPILTVDAGWGGGSMRHMSVAAAGLVALAAWPAAARRRGPSVPWGLRPAVSVGASAVLLAVLLWFGAELLTSGGQAGLAERLLGGLQTLWPVLVILSCRLSRPGTQPPGVTTLTDHDTPSPPHPGSST
jgi:hypothetical protein